MQRPAQAAALDYVERGYDADLGTVRFGARDYDPELGQFWSPDPLFLVDIEKCAQSPFECNLYGYAKGNSVPPTTLPFPDGMKHRAAFGRLIGWTQGGTLEGNFARTQKLIEALPQRIGELRAAGVTREISVFVAKRSARGAAPFSLRNQTSHIPRGSSDACRVSCSPCER